MFYDDTVQTIIRDNVAGQVIAPFVVLDSTGAQKLAVGGGAAGTSGVGLVVGSVGTPLTAIFRASAALTPVAVAANTSAEQTFNPAAFASFVTGDTVIVNKPTAQAGLGIVGARISANGTLAITFGNFTAAPITPTAGEAYAVTAIRS